MKRRKKFIDKRLNWRDPDMPVLRIAKKEGDTEYKPYEFRADWIQLYHKNAMNSYRIEPTWKNDPSYFWAKDKKKK